MDRIIILSVFLALVFTTVPAQDKNPATASNNLKEFAGRYVYSSGFVGAVYNIADDGKFEFNTFSDCCDPVWRETGIFTLIDNQLHFKISRKTLNSYDLLDPKQATEAFRKLYNDKGPEVIAGDIETEYDVQIVKWGDRTYLIEPHRLYLFAAAVNFGVEPRARIINNNYLTTRFYLRRGDEDKAVSGKPSLPEPFKSYLQDSPLKTTVTKIESLEKANIYTVNRGSADGVKVGMAFIGENVEPDYDNLLWVISTEEKSSKVKSYSIFRAFNYEVNSNLTSKIIEKPK